MLRTTVLSLSGLGLASAYTFRVWRGPMAWATHCVPGEGVTFGQLTVTTEEIGNCQRLVDITSGTAASYIVTNGTTGPTIVLDSTADCSGSAVAFPPTRVVMQDVPWSAVGQASGDCTLPAGLGALAGVAVQSVSSSWDETDGSPIELFATADCAPAAGPVTTYLRSPTGTCTRLFQDAAARVDACTATGLTVSVFPGDLQCANDPILPSLAGVILPVDGTCMNLFPATGTGPFPAGFSVRVTQPCVGQAVEAEEPTPEPTPSSVPSPAPAAGSPVPEVEPPVSRNSNGASSRGGHGHTSLAISVVAGALFGIVAGGA